ncbi:hypothetical protein ACJMK2_044720, partial [Sinanodonta woodiana]
APEVELRTSRIGQYRGKETKLECLVKAFPQGISLWKKGDNTVFNDSTNWKYRTEVYKENAHTMALYLRIINLEEDDYGLYTCESSNRLGNDSESMILYEYVDPTTRGPFKTRFTERTTKVTTPMVAMHNKIKLEYKEFQNHKTYDTYNVCPGSNFKAGSVIDT